jgi:3-oxoacyl-[acyl-carrier protein] reductase
MSLQNTEPTSLIQRFIDPEEIANAVAFISSDLASAMNGSSYRCEGGIVKHI